MKCTRCPTVNEKDAAFCEQCGTKLNTNVLSYYELYFEKYNLKKNLYDNYRQLKTAKIWKNVFMALFTVVAIFTLFSFYKFNLHKDVITEKNVNIKQIEKSNNDMKSKITGLEQEKDSLRLVNSYLNKKLSGLTIQPVHTTSDKDLQKAKEDTINQLRQANKLLESQNEQKTDKIKQLEIDVEAANALKNFYKKRSEQ